MKLLLFNLFLSVCMFAQVADTDIWLFKIQKKDGRYFYSNPLNITARHGYDNQPTFSWDGKSILYVCIDSTNQSDIYQYSINKRKSRNITKSDVSEYSPTILPNGLDFSCVVVEKDSTQRIWKFNNDGKFIEIVHEDTDSIGYHTWLSNDSLVYYKLTNPHSLRVLSLKTGQDNWLSDYPSRSFKKITGSSQFMYAVKDSLRIQYRIYNPLLRESMLYAVSETENEDFIWHPELGLIKSENAELLQYNPQLKTWDILFSFSTLGINKITRFVFDSKTKQLALVSNL